MKKLLIMANELVIAQGSNAKLNLFVVFLNDLAFVFVSPNHNYKLCSYVGDTNFHVDSRKLSQVTHSGIEFGNRLIQWFSGKLLLNNDKRNIVLIRLIKLQVVSAFCTNFEFVLKYGIISCDCNSAMAKVFVAQKHAVRVILKIGFGDFCREKCR